MSEFSSSEMQAALAHFKRLRSGNSSTSKPAASHLSETIRSLEGQLLKSDAALRNARHK